MYMLFLKISVLFQTTLLQVQLEGLSDAAKTSPLNGALVGFIIILLAAIVVVWKHYNSGRKELNKELKELNKEHAAKLEENRKEYIEKFEKLQNQYLQREEIRNKQWSESEKETLQVLNGVTSILEMSEKMGQKDTNEILDKLRSLEDRIIGAINNKTNG